MAACHPNISPKMRLAATEPVIMFITRFQLHIVRMWDFEQLMHYNCMLPRSFLFIQLGGRIVASSDFSFSIIPMGIQPTSAVVYHIFNSTRTRNCSHFRDFSLIPEFMSKNIYEMHFPSNLENKNLCSVYSEGISLAVGLMRVQISITGMTHIYDGMSERQLRTNSTEYLQN